MGFTTDLNFVGVVRGGGITVDSAIALAALLSCPVHGRHRFFPADPIPGIDSVPGQYYRKGNVYL